MSARCRRWCARSLFGGLIGIAGYPVAFAVCALFPLVALPLVPVETAD